MDMTTKNEFLYDFETIGGNEFRMLVDDSQFNNIAKKHPQIIQNVVQIISKNGTVKKGPKYDTTTYPKHGSYDTIVDKFLNGKSIQEPFEPSRYEPRDRIQEIKNMKLQKFKSLIQECLTEVKEENKTKEQVKESLRVVVRKVLKEIASKKSEKPDKDEIEKSNKGFDKNGNARWDKSNMKLVKELETIVHGIDPEWCAMWDDNGDLRVNANNQLTVRITPNFDNNFDIEAMVKLVDRIRVVSVTWEQVKTFVKENFGNLKNETSPDVAKQKSADNAKSKDKNNGKDAGPRHDITKEKKVGDTKKDNKDFNEKSVEKDEDQPSAPMKDVGEPKNLNKNIEKTSFVKPTKHKKNDGDDKLKTNLPSTKKFRTRK